MTELKILTTKTITTMILKNGKFYDKNGAVVPLEFGNKEQINLIQEKDRQITKLKTDGEDVEVEKETTYTVSYKCVCGYGVEFTAEGAPDDDEILDGEEVACFKCKTKYILKGDRYGNYIIKIKK